MLLIYPIIANQMKAAVQFSDEECCGFLFGQEENSDLRTITAMMTAKNISSLDRRSTFEISPQDYMDAESFAVQHHLKLLGVYHTHHETPAIPSEFDRIAAHPYFSYVILSIVENTVDDMKSWTLNENFKFEEEPISIININQQIHGYRNHSNSAA
ncbi:MAG TPA: M67 family metallopeptidase [Chryseolinea sp.]|nr:M67 family metallopeptidase [Chryseolinea sp.]